MTLDDLHASTVVNGKIAVQAIVAAVYVDAAVVMIKMAICSHFLPLL